MLTKATTLQAVKFLIVGGVSTVINYGSFFILLTWLHWHYLVASVVGYVLGLIFGYILNRNWSFAEHKQVRMPKEFVRYLGVYLFSLVCNSLVLMLGVRWLQFDPRLANIIAIMVSMVSNFVGLKLFVFRHTTPVPSR